MNPKRFPRRGLVWCALALAAVGGCGGDGIHPVDGQVVWEDGAPATELAGSHVVFDLPAKQTSARGIVAADAKFRLKTKDADGALAGEYKVLVIEANRQPLGGADATELAPGKMDSRYSDPSTTDLVASVKPGSNQIT